MDAADGLYVLGGVTEIGIIADTHGELHPGIPEAFKGVDLILHAGDVGGDHVLKALRTLAPTMVVEGNNDPPGLYGQAVEFLVNDLRIHMSHGHERGWWPTAEWMAGKYTDCDVIVFGHTHKKVSTMVGQTMVINPGAAKNPRPSVARLNVVTRALVMITLPKVPA